MDGMYTVPLEIRQYTKALEQGIQQLKKENKELQQRMTALEEENRTLREKVQKLEARLRVYENPHTPPSKQRFKRNHGGSSTGRQERGKFIS